MESKGVLAVFAIFVLGISPINAFSDSDIQSIDAEIDLKPYDDNRVELDIRFFDEKNHDVRQINYHIIVTQDGKTVHEQIVYDADGKGTHITDSLESFSHIEIIIKVNGFGLSKPYAGPTDELFFTLSTTSHYLTTYTDQAKYSSGDAMRIYGHTDSNDPPSVSMIIKAANSNVVYIKHGTLYNNEFSFDLIADGEAWNNSGEYVVTVNHGNDVSHAIFWFDMKTNTVETIDIPEKTDSVAPLLLVPEDILVNTLDNKIKIDYSVKAIDDVDGILQPICNPSSGSYFGIGDTLVTCSTKDYAGNKVQEKFLVTVSGESQNIPVWIRDVAGFWCSGEIDDSGFIEGIQYLIENNVLIISGSTDKGNSGDAIPSWIKNNACWWSEEAISDDEFSTGIQYLISNGIIRVS